MGAAATDNLGHLVEEAVILVQPTDYSDPEYAEQQERVRRALVRLQVAATAQP